MSHKVDVPHHSLFRHAEDIGQIVDAAFSFCSTATGSGPATDKITDDSGRLFAGGVRTYEAFFALILTAVVYFLIQALMVKIVRIIQKKIDPRRRSDKKILAGIDASEWELF